MHAGRPGCGRPLPTPARGKDRARGARMHTHTRTHLRTRTRAHTLAHCAHACTHARTHARTHAHTCVRACPQARRRGAEEPYARAVVEHGICQVAWVAPDHCRFQPGEKTELAVHTRTIASKHTLANAHSLACTRTHTRLHTLVRAYLMHTCARAPVLLCTRSRTRERTHAAHVGAGARTPARTYAGRVRDPACTAQRPR